MVIPVAVHKQQLGLRLLELPSDIADLVESDSAPTLLLKSSETSAQHTQGAETAVLCTPDKTFQIRQVQSSNVLYILRQTADSGYAAIAQCKGLLELVPGQDNALDYIRQYLPNYATDISTRNKITHDALVDNTPFSEGEIENALKRLCVFEDDGGLWIPTAGNLREAWKSLLTVATINGVKLDQLWSVVDIEKQVIEDGTNVEIYRAMLRHLSDSENSLEARLDSVRTVTWIGLIMLNSNEEPMQKLMFITQWQDQLPESWREFAGMELLQNKYSVSANGLISPVQYSKPSTDAKKTILASKSKWHQKFQKPN